MLKGSLNPSQNHFFILINRSFEVIFPDLWKIANIIPIFKKGDKSLPSNYIPVALLSYLAKLQERILQLFY